MPRELKRYYGAHDLHFITCSCYRRLPLLDTADRRDLLLNLLEEVRQRHRFVVLGYVVMPEHFHLLISESQETTPSIVMQVLKQRFAHQVLAQLRKQRSASPRAAGEIWQRRFYDFNVWTEHKRIEKLRYMHRNPVKQAWSSSPSSGRGAAFATTPSEKRGRYRSTTARCLN